MSLVAELIIYCHVSSGEALWGRSGHLARPKSKKVPGNARSPNFFVLKHKFFGPRVSRKWHKRGGAEVQWHSATYDPAKKK